MAAQTSSGGGGGTDGVLEMICGRRVDYHQMRKTYSVLSNASENGFYLETLNPSAGNQKLPHEVAFGGEKTGSAPGKRVEGGAEFYEHGLDQELGFHITFRRIGAGLANLGNTCFLNSVLQCLTYTEPFAAYLQSGKHKTSCRTAGFCALCALQNHVMTALQSTGKILSPFQLVKNLRCISRNFRNSRQEDAHEYMVNLLESMHKCCLPSGVPSESPSAYEKSLVHKIFGGRLRSQVKCTQCEFCSNTYDPFLDLSLEIEKAETLRRALSNFTAVEKLDGGEKQYQCQRCKQKVRALKQLTIHKPPHVLTVHLKRFSSYIPGKKIDKKVEFEPFLDLKPFVSDPNEGNLKYILYGVLVHAGWNTHSGHYYCFVRTSSGMWHSLDDNQVRQVSEKTVLAQKAYMLFYVRDRGPVRSSVGSIQKQNAGANSYGSKINPQPTAPLNGANALFRPMDSTKVHTNPNAASSSVPVLQNGNLVPVKKPSDSQSNGNSSPNAASPSVPVLQNGILVPVQRPSDSQSNGNSHPETVKDTTAKGLIRVPSAAEPSVATTATGNSSGKVSEILDERPQKESGNVATHAIEVQKVIGSDTNNGVDAKPEFPQGDTSNGVDALVKIESLGNASNDVNTSAKPGSVGNASNGVDASAKPESKDNKLETTSNVPEINQKKLLKESVVPKYNASTDKEEPCEEKAKVNDAKPVNQSSPAPTASTTQSVDSKIHDKVEIKSRKLMKHPAKIVCFARNMLFVHTLRMQKNKKFNKAKRRRLASKERNNVVTSDQQASTSTSNNGHVEAPKEEKSRKRKHSKRCCMKNEGDALGVDVLKEDLSSIKSDIELATKDQSEVNQAATKRASIDHPVANNIVIKEQERSQRCESYSFLMAGLRETTVPTWDGSELPKVEMQDGEPSKRKSIGYIGDDWDEDYDKGKRKKVKQSRVEFGGPNPFQQKADIHAQKKMRKLRGSIGSGKQPFRN